MSKGLKFSIFISLALVNSFCCPQPSQAILGESADLVRTYFNGKKGEPTRLLEKRSRMLSFATMRKEARPQSLFMYTDAQGLIQRELWVAPMQGMWKPEQADKIRDAIMAGRSLNGSVPLGMMGRRFLYGDGSWVAYRTSKGLIYSILAVDKSFHPGDLGVLPKDMQPEKKIIKPR